MEEYNKIFDQLWQHTESEIVEFKKAESNFDFDELGRYLSALSNEANLRELNVLSRQGSAKNGLWVINRQINKNI